MNGEFDEIARLLSDVGDPDDLGGCAGAPDEGLAQADGKRRRKAEQSGIGARGVPIGEKLELMSEVVSAKMLLVPGIVPIPRSH